VGEDFYIVAKKRAAGIARLVHGLARDLERSVATHCFVWHATAAYVCLQHRASQQRYRSTCFISLHLQHRLLVEL
jgi:hypothetical protein